MMGPHLGPQILYLEVPKKQKKSQALAASRTRGQFKNSFYINQDADNYKCNVAAQLTNGGVHLQQLNRQCGGGDARSKEKDSVEGSSLQETASGNGPKKKIKKYQPLMSQERVQMAREVTRLMGWE